MLFKLILIVTTFQGVNHEYVLDYNLTRDDCVSALIELNNKYHTDKFECQGNEQ